ncbi:hypothetical protein KBB41_02380 [Candidatus Curtissbacteria bacterium]|nr:hypothetical protein [Candidatus Curtissbacteria bacterium]
MKSVFGVMVLVGMVFVTSACDPVQGPPSVLRVNNGSTNSAQVDIEESGVSLTANFEIEADGIKRNFSRGMYMNLSKDVYIESPESSNVVRVKKEGITWSDFFKTLPMSLAKDCLITGTKQEFCTNETKKLKFFVNDVENPDALDEVIKQDDRLRVVYGE